MPNTWTTNLRDFLDADGNISDCLSSPALRLLAYFGAIVAAVTSCKVYEYETPRTGITCRRRPGRKPCTGEILAVIDAEHDFPIRWQCPACGDNGFISGWQGTVWDKDDFDDHFIISK